MASRVSSEQSIDLGSGHLSSLLNSTQELLAIVHSDGSLLFANQKFSALLGYPSHQLVGASIFSFLHPNEEPDFRSNLRSPNANSSAEARSRCRLQGKDGSWRWFEVSVRDFPHEASSDALIVGLVDVTDLHRMESERQVISDVVHALNESANLDQLLVLIHGALKKVVYAENCIVALHDPESDTFHFPFFVDQFDPPPPPQKLDRSCTAFVFRTGRAMLIPQAEFDRLAALGEVELVGAPSPSWLGVPLKTPTATIGVLVVQHYSNESAYDQRDLEFLDSVGGHIALAIERRRAEDALSKSESMFRLLFAHNPLPTWVFDSETLRFLRVNDAAIAQYGYSHDEFESMNVADICHASDYGHFRESIRQLKGKPRYKTTCKHLAKDGRTIEAELIAHQLDYNGRAVHLVVAQDIGERHQLEEQLRQAQKMEAVGRLAGGVAHDFNNLLMVIKGHTELLMNVLPPSDVSARKIEQIDRAADRATSLTRQLLAFSRMQVLQPRVLDLNGVVSELGKMLPRLIGEHIEYTFSPDPNLASVKADPGQIEQVILNLAANARDAMPRGGKLTMRTANISIDQAEAAKRPPMTPGLFILLSVSDTGHGMDEATKAHIFEPFFTTKEIGKGTGLGLATVYGVVKQSDGFIWVESSPGVGTTFEIYLPQIVGKAADAEAEEKTSMIPGGSETVLVVEDESGVRELACQFLRVKGYTVLEAEGGLEALAVSRRHPGTIHLLLSDMVMPKMSGGELAAQLKATRPDIRIAFMSGYSEFSRGDLGKGFPEAPVLQKPFSPASLVQIVREALTRPVAKASHEGSELHVT